MSNWVKDTANTDISPMLASAAGWGPKQYFLGTHSAWLFIHAVLLHGVGAWLTYSATKSTQQLSQQMMAQAMGLREGSQTDVIGGVVRQVSLGSFVTTVAWCLAAFACSRVVADAFRERNQ